LVQGALPTDWLNPATEINAGGASSTAEDVAGVAQRMSRIARQIGGVHDRRSSRSKVGLIPRQRHLGMPEPMTIDPKATAQSSIHFYRCE
jgi:hypothetical protein